MTYFRKLKSLSKIWSISTNSKVNSMITSSIGALGIVFKTKLMTTSMITSYKRMRRWTRTGSVTCFSGWESGIRSGRSGSLKTMRSHIPWTGVMLASEESAHISRSRLLRVFLEVSLRYCSISALALSIALELLEVSIPPKSWTTLRKPWKSLHLSPSRRRRMRRKKKKKNQKRKRK